MCVCVSYLDAETTRHRHRYEYRSANIAHGFVSMGFHGAIETNQHQ